MHTELQKELLIHKLENEPHTLQLWVRKSKGFWEIRQKGAGKLLKRTKTKSAADKIILECEAFYIKIKSEESESE